MNRPRPRPHPMSPLSSTEVDVAILDLTAEYTIRHMFRNTGEEAIEAVYSFPIPLDAAFIAMAATLAGECRQAQVLPARQASLTYDDAISEGDSAVLVEQVEPGLLCVNLGNLKPAETGEIELRFAAPLRIADRTARFSLPLVHRPRYGRSSLDEIVEPGHDFAVEHPMQATIRVSGLLAEAAVQCASHPARFSRNEGALTLELPHAMLDRDVVINFELESDLAPTGRLIADGTDTIGMFSFVVPVSETAEARPLDLCVVMDGSLSMSGDAIAQSRAALQAVTAALHEHDRIQGLRFGSSVVPMFRRPLRATAKVREALDALRETIDSNLGGTEIGTALEQAIRGLVAVRHEGRNAAIVLVTDGAVQPGEVVSAEAAALAAGIRIFVVAVGSSAGADVLAPLAEATGAVLERAVPAEPIDACVMRQFRRARERAPVSIETDWSIQGARPLPVGVCYPGDAVTALAFLPGSAGGDAHVRIAGSELSELRFTVSRLETMPALRSLAGQTGYRHATETDRQSLAVRYGLLTPETSAVLVKTRAEGDKIDKLPIVRPVEHMVPEGLIASRAMGGMACYIPRSSSVEFPNDVHHSFDPFVDLAGYSNAVRIQPELQTLPSIPPKRVVQLVGEVYPVLLGAVRSGDLKSTTLADVLERLDELKRGDMQRLIESVSLQLDRPAHVAVLIHLLLQLRGDDVLTDDEEAQLAIAMAADVSTSNCWDAELDALDCAIREGVPSCSRGVQSQVN